MKWDGHVSIGPLTIYGDNAMHWAWNLRTPWGYLCARPTTWKTIEGERFYTRWYAYLSPNATPDRATWGVGPGFNVHGWVRESELG